MVNPENMLFVRPHDCHYCGNGWWALYHVVQYAQSKGKWDITDLEGTQAELTPVHNALDTQTPLGLYGFGHGGPSVYTGNSENVIFSTTTGTNKLNNKIIYLLSCLTAQQLGLKIVQDGGKSYAGFMQEWNWLIEGSTDDDPYYDKYGKCFFESANQLWVAMIDGASFQEAINASMAKYNEWIDYWYDSGDPNTPMVVGNLAHDRDILMAYGDLNATLEMGPDPMNQYTNETDCETNGGYWWADGTCHSFPEYTGNLPFRFYLTEFLPYIVAGGAILIMAIYYFFFRQ